MAKGLLLGAGFSYNLGMPLAYEFSEVLFHYLDKNKIAWLLENMRGHLPYGDDSPLCEKTLERLLEISKEFLSESNGNYESLFKKLEEESIYESSAQRTRHYFLSKLKSIINELFIIFQQDTYLCYLINYKFYEWILNGFEKEDLWIFSLNHDLLIEMLCIDNKIPLKLGYNEKTQIPNRNENNDKFLEFGVIDATIEDINLLDYYKSQKGINLLKIHGGLNEFFQGDEKSGRKRVFFMPEKYERSRDYLNDIINFWHDTHYSINGRTVPVEGEICVSDNAGELQFFQPTILTGSKKYTKTLKTQKREEKIALFSSGLKNIDELYIVGYGFGDEHINNRIVNAMHLNEKMKLTIIDPSGAKHKILEPFDYDLRVCYANMDFSVWSDYIKTGQWDPEIRKHLDTSTVPLRKRIIESIKNNIVPK